MRHDPTDIRRILLLAFITALVARVGCMLLFNQHIAFADEGRFWGRGHSLVTEHTLWGPGGGLGSDMPLAPLFFALVQFLGGSVLAGKLLTCVAGSLAVFPVGLVAHRLHDSPRAAGFAAFAAALYPTHVYFSGLLLSEPFFFTLLPAVFLALLAEPGPAHAPRAGFAAGLAHLARPTLLYFLPVAAAWAWLARRWNLRRTLLAALAFAVLVAPWAVRNWNVYHRFMITTTGSGQVLWEGNNPWNEDGGVARPEWGYLEGLPDGPDPVQRELERDDWKKQKAEAFIKENPGRFARLAVNKFLRFWALWPSAESITSWKVRTVSVLSFGPVLLLALASLRVLRDRFRDTSLLWLFMGYYTALHMVTIGSIRYRLPLDGLLIALAAAALARLAGPGPGARRLR
ncbi:MAG: glycosyltransferase family 39 protein [Desulfovibrionaceae bacterium]|jgi:hypothetical protein|nr:glycosyltransferase family 39 protein [Desulfovibrionaceae bacterium]